MRRSACAVAPVDINDSTDDCDSPARTASLAARTMMGRNGVADDFRGVTVFLASPAAAYVTGRLSQAGHFSFKTGVVDITTGNNSFSAVSGFDAGTGYDLSSGWGTIDAGQFVRALAHG